MTTADTTATAAAHLPAPPSTYGRLQAAMIADELARRSKDRRPDWVRRRADEDRATDALKHERGYIVNRVIGRVLSDRRRWR